MAKTHTLITGACGAIGRALAVHWQHDHQLYLLDHDPLALEKLADTLQNDPILIPFDLWRSPVQDYQKLQQLLNKEHPYLDQLIHLAAYSGNLRPIIHTDPEEWLKTLQINLTAPLWLTQQLLPLLLKSTHPRIVFTPFDTLGEQAHYWHGFGVAQSALERLIRDLYEENAAYPQISWIKLHTGWVESSLSRNIFPNGKKNWHYPEDILPLFDEIQHSPKGKLHTLGPL